MPAWLQITLGVISGAVGATTILRIWLSPLFAQIKEIKNNSDRIKALEKYDLDDLMDRIKSAEEKLGEDYKARRKSEKIQKAQIKALIALLNFQISGNGKDVMAKVRDELNEQLVEHI